MRYTCSCLNPGTGLERQTKRLSVRTRSVFESSHCPFNSEHTVCYQTVKDGEGEERAAFPGTHLVLMQGPLVWITGPYYRRTRADPSSLSLGKREPAVVMGVEGLGGLGSKGVNKKTCGHAATPHEGVSPKLHPHVHKTACLDTNRLDFHPDLTWNFSWSAISKINQSNGL